MSKSTRPAVYDRQRHPESFRKTPIWDDLGERWRELHDDSAEQPDLSGRSGDVDEREGSR